jgi:two-component system, NtrC family, nitrogen regulation sensor histidine kinase NtrY
LLLGIYLVRQVLQPLAFARQFQELLQDQNYAARMRVNANAELNSLVAMFNRLLESLYQERLKLGEQRGLLDKLLAATPTAVMVFDFDGEMSLLNSSAQQMLGANSSAATTFNSPLAIELLAFLHALPVGESRVFADVEGRRYRCQRGQFIDRSFTRDFILVDEISAELAHSEKATYEKLVRVLAHEVNNTVAATGSVLESLLFYRQQLKPEDGTDFYTAISAVRRRNTNLGEFIERFTRVVKMPTPELRPTNLREMIDGVMQLYRTQCDARGIALAWRSCDEIEAQMVDAQLLEQALVNIIKNAVEACESVQSDVSKPVYVHIALALAPAEAHNSGAPRQVRLSVIDSANRLADVPHGQLFTPFFTTKKGGQGIGLIFVREVLNRHGFAHRLASNTKAETQFDIWIA